MGLIEKIKSIFKTDMITNTEIFECENRQTKLTRAEEKKVINFARNAFLKDKSIVEVYGGYISIDTEKINFLLCPRRDWPDNIMEIRFKNNSDYKRFYLDTYVTNLYNEILDWYKEKELRPVIDYINGLENE